MREPVVRIAVDELHLDQAPRGTDHEHVRALAAAGDLPPVVVHRPTMRVVDGHHRVRAARLRGDRDVPVRYLDGDERAAFVHAVQANLPHLDRADRKRAARRVIADHPHWSDRRIAAVTGLSPKTVAAQREGRDTPERVGRDGRARPVDPARRRRVAGDLLRENPALSLRQVAAMAGISPETARSVRSRLSRGEDPVPPRPRGAAAPATAPPVDADWPAAVRGLRTDPSLRFTDSGRALLRLLDAYALPTRRWAAVGGNVPAHCRPVVARAALECARDWTEFAEQVARSSA